MPFVVRKLEPRYVCRGHVPTAAGASRNWPVGAELEACANGALTASLKQLASLLGAAEDIFAELTRELAGIADRSGRLRLRLDRVEEKLAQQDPKKIPVPESDICTFALRTEHFHVKNEPERCLFTLDTRPMALRQLYEAAAAVAVKSLDSLRRDRDATSSLDMFMCTPILGKRRRDQSLDIESRVPRAIEELRRWTSAEALGDVTVAPDCMSRILGDSVDDSRPVDHKLPSPEEQVQAVALKFPAEIVAVDVSGRGFQRMSMRRRSMHQTSQEQETVKRRSRPRRPRGKRRNTIAGTDQKEIRQAVGGETTADEPEETRTSGTSKRAHRSASTDLLGSGAKKDSPVEKKSHFNTLKAWGMSRLKLISPKSSQQQNHLYADVNESTAAISSAEQQQQQAENEIRSADETYETLSNSRRTRRDASKTLGHERKPSSSSSSGKSVSSMSATIKHQQQQQQANGPVSKDESEKEHADNKQQPSSRQSSNVKLRESAAERRERRKASSRADEPPHSSSGNWSASSESGRASIGSETTTTTHPPRSTTTASIGTSSTSLSHARRLKGRDTSASSSVTSEGTLTPDIIQDINVVPFSDDGETSSVYSCDTEGYYTSFHMDSGLKTLREEEPPLPQSPLAKTNEVQSDPTSPVVENEYELFGRGSTSTTTSSAGTVCTTLMAPPPPERKSSLTVVAMVHGQNQNGGESPDSGHNTSSSPVESASSPACTGRSCSEFEYSESSDLEGCERIERIRSKTAINTSRIPSMCVITPPGSDDEHNHQQKDTGTKEQKSKKERNACQGPGSVLMSATVGTSKMEVINGQDKNLYATVQTVAAPNSNNTDKGPTGQNTKVSPLSGVLGKLRGVLPGRKHQQKPNSAQEGTHHQQPDSGDYVTIADVRNNNNKRRQDNTGTTSTTVRSGAVTYANADLFKRDAEYVSLSELPKKPDSSLERRRQGARVTLDSEGKVVYSSDSLKRRKGAHTTFIPGPFVKEGPSSPVPSPLLHRAQITPRAVQRTTADVVDGEIKSSSETAVAAVSQQPQQPGKVIIRAAKSPDRAASPDYVRTPATVVGPTTTTTSTSAQRQARQGAYVNVQGSDSEGKTATGLRRPGNSSGRKLTANSNNGSVLNLKSKIKSGSQSLSCNNNNSRLNKIREEVRNIDSKAVENTENKPPEYKSRARHPMTLRFRHKPNNSLERKILKPNLRQLNSNLSKTALIPSSLIPNGDTPKLIRRLPMSDPDPKTDLDNVDSSVYHNKENTESVANGVTTIESNSCEPKVEDAVASDVSSDKLTETPRIERKIKRSESYRMANSPIMFIKKLSSGGSSSSSSDKNSQKIFRTASEELREDLLKESINYPESVASPEPGVDLEDSISNSEDSLSSSLNISNNSTSKLPHSPRPRTIDLEPARVLKYSGTDTEIW